MKKLFKWFITIKLQHGTEITTVATADSIGKACNAMKYTAEKLNGEIIKIKHVNKNSKVLCNSNKTSIFVIQKKTNNKLKKKNYETVHDYFSKQKRRKSIPIRK